MTHSGTLAKVRNIEAAFERAANNLLAKVDPIDTERTVALSQVVHDRLNNYALPSDYKKILDLFPQDNRTSLDDAQREYAGNLDLRKEMENKRVSIEGSEGSKIIRINWKSRAPVTFHQMDSLTSGGTITAVGSASGLAVSTLYKVSGSGSIQFSVVASGDGIQSLNTTTLDLTDWNQQAEAIIPVFFGAVTALTSITFVFGNDLSTKYWTAVAQTAQADGTAFKVGWNYLKFPWSSATQTGTVAPATIDSWKLTIQSTGAIPFVRVDNIMFSLGRNFDIKYYSKYLFKNSAGTFLARPSSDDDTCILDSDAINLFIYELLDACAQQIEGEDSSFDISFAGKKLYGDPNAIDSSGRRGLYAMYRGEYPTQAKKAVTHYTSGPRFRR